MTTTVRSVRNEHQASLIGSKRLSLACTCGWMTPLDDIDGPEVPALLKARFWRHLEDLGLREPLAPAAARA